jgi:hypothetical protein
MTLNKISAEIPQETENQIIQQIKDAKTALAFMVALSSEERVRLAKLSRGHVDFVDRSLIHAQANPQYLPSYVSLEEFAKDMELKNSLHRIRTELNALAQRINDTILVVESEAYQTARLFYKSVKAASKEGAEDAERISKDLSYHYKKKRSSKTETDETDNTTPEQPG